MNKLKAVFTALCILFLYYIVRPIHCLFQATIESLIEPKLNVFVEVYKFSWAQDYVEVGTYWAYVKELWNGK
jgi:hypothetical protein